MPAELAPSSFAAIDGWDGDDHAAALEAFRTGARRIVDQSPVTGAFGVDGAELQRVARIALSAGAMGASAAKVFFEAHFTPCRICAEGFVTAYFEPELEARLTPGDGFDLPLYRRPADLIDIDPLACPQGWDTDRRFGRVTPAGVQPYFDRPAIEAGALAGRGLEIAWLRSHVDAFFIHVQGSARLRLADGATMRVGYDGKSGHAYTSIGRLAVERGLLTREAAHKDGLDAWLRENPEAGRRLMAENRSFIFFRQTGQADGEGPIGAAGAPLTPYRSLAVDCTRMTFHAPIWVSAESLADPQHPDRSYRKLMIAQDTGSAIVGPARGDLFFGSGDAAGSLAGQVRHRAEMTVLAPRPDGPR